MENKFLKEVNRVKDLTFTENGGVAYSDSVLNPLVKWLYNVSDNRAKVFNTRYNMENTIEKRNSVIDTDMTKEIVEVAKTMNLNDKETLARFLAYIRDPRKGLGERSLFRTVLTKLLSEGIFTPNTDNYDFCKAVVEYGRWDDLIALIFTNKYNKNNVAYSTKLVTNMINFVKEQLFDDIKQVNEGNTNISLLAKWMPSINSSSKQTRHMANTFIKCFGVNAMQYRKALSRLRDILNIVETNVCQNRYEEINYEQVPSLAMDKYKYTFMNKDNKRYNSYLESVKKGEAKINANVVDPVTLVTQYLSKSWYDWKPTKLDETIEAQWKALPEVNVSGNILPVMDLSGSMSSNITNKIRSIDVSFAMGIYLSEHNKGVFKDKAFAFADKTQVLDFSDCKTLFDKVRKVCNTKVEFTTNVENCLLTVLEMARNGNCSQDEIPTLVMITDCEFNQISELKSNTRTLTVFERVSKEFEKYGYKLPKIVFWNTQNRSKSVPLTQNENGLMLMSGFSQNIIKMISSNELDPLKVLLETLNEQWLDNSVKFVK